MLLEESIWFKERLSNIINAAASPVLNIGSSTKHFRSVIQSHIDRNIFSVLEQHGLKVIHLDQKNAEGVDVVGNFSDAAFLQKVKALQCKAIFCNNLLMHLEKQDRDNLVQVMDHLLPSGGFIYLSTSQTFPYTPDPYDSYYRPNPDELYSLFKNYKLVDKAVVLGQDSLFKSAKRNPRFAAILLTRLVTPFYKFRSWSFLMKYLPKFFEPYSAACLILQKQ